MSAALILVILVLAHQTRLAPRLRMDGHRRARERVVVGCVGERTVQPLRHALRYRLGPPEAALRHRILLPVLGERYGAALQDGSIVVRRESGRFTVTYFDHVFPLPPRSLDNLLASAAEHCASDELAFLADAASHLPPATATDESSVSRRHRDKEVLRLLLADLCARQPTVAAADAVVHEISASPEKLDGLLERQNYRLAFWRAADRDLDYRRFFDINALIALRVNDPHVFADTHALILRWLNEGVLDGVRIDHIDGLRDSDLYLDRLRERAPVRRAPGSSRPRSSRRAPAAWPIAETTGYDFLNVADGLFVDPSAEASLTDTYDEFIGERLDYAEVARENKLRMLRESLGSDVNRLTALLLDVSQGRWPARDFMRYELQDALREIVADTPVYRTYIRAEGGPLTVACNLAGERRRVPLAGGPRRILLASTDGLELAADSIERLAECVAIALRRNAPRLAV